MIDFPERIVFDEFFTKMPPMPHGHIIPPYDTIRLVSGVFAPIDQGR